MKIDVLIVSLLSELIMTGDNLDPEDVNEVFKFFQQFIKDKIKKSSESMLDSALTEEKLFNHYHTLTESNKQLLPIVNGKVDEIRKILSDDTMCYEKRQKDLDIFKESIIIKKKELRELEKMMTKLNSNKQKIETGSTLENRLTIEAYKLSTNTRFDYASSSIDGYVKQDHRIKTFSISTNEDPKIITDSLWTTIYEVSTDC